MKDLPIGIHTFADLVSGNMLYIDKTAYIYGLVKPAKGVYFLSRPRRFGKSLLISTLGAIFEGRRDLFAGLFIAEQTDYSFESYPVFQIDLSNRKVYSKEDLEQYVIYVTNLTAAKYEIELTQTAYEVRFGELLRKLSEINKVVVLIDEYDKPLLDNIAKPEREEIKEALKGFYATIKASDAYLRFVLLTGVTKFSKISVFSGLNNLMDISMDTRYAELLGITQTELESYFQPRLSQLAEGQHLSMEKLLEKIRYWYNGYRFSIKESYIYNPFSTLLLLEQQQFNFHWFETGTPTFLIELMKQKSLSWSHIYEQPILPERAFSTYEVERLDPLPLLFQTGYFTIKEVIPTNEEYLYRLGYPNYEVRKSFLAEVLDNFTEVYASESYTYRMAQWFREGNLEEVMAELQIFFANVPYDLQLKHEKYYQTIFYIIFVLLGFTIQAEVKTNRGRIDAVVETKDTVYLFEFKLFGTKEEALAQIKQQGYAEKYRTGGKAIMLIGVEFNQAERNIGEWLVERLAEN